LSRFAAWPNPTRRSNACAAHSPCTSGLTPYFITLEIQFKPTIGARGIEGVVDRIEKKIRNRFPDIEHILIEAESITALEKNALAR
jgi:hypothetical protein